MDTTRIQTVIIGAGQAGLATGYHLRRRGRPFVILDGAARVGDNWRRQWDSLRLYSPAQYDGLPGLPFPARRWSFPGKDEVGNYLESYAATFDLPVHLETRVTALDADGDGFRVTTDRGTWLCDNVVVATGTFGRTPCVPDVAGQVDPSVLQLHSSDTDVLHHMRSTRPPLPRPDARPSLQPWAPCTASRLSFHETLMF